MLLSELLGTIQPIEVIGRTDIQISNLHFDSRQIGAGDLFVAQVGTAVDGHTFIESCVAKGCAAVVLSNKAYMPKEPSDKELSTTYILVENTDHALGMLASQWFGNPSHELTLVGVTGTNGKTTIATLLYKLVRALGHKAGLLSTVVNYIDDEAIAATHTTPDAIALNSLLRRMVDAGCEYAFMEVSSHSIAQERIAGLDFDGALFTNLTRDHIDYHKTFDNYRDTKKRLFDGLKKSAFAITNKDDKNGLVMTQNCQATVCTYSTRSLADYKAQILEEGFDGMLLHINNREVFVPLVGRFNVSNLLCIYGAALSLGFSETDVLCVLSTLRPVNGRFETIHSPKGWTAIVDYAHTPDAVDNVIQTIREIKKEGARLITVVGCGGNRDKGKRPMMAQIAKRGSEQLILTSDNPRNEDPKEILKDMTDGLNTDELRSTLVIEDRAAAIQTACTLAQANDVILIAGKGHEDYQIIQGVKHHFDDHEEVKKYI
ncbi:MAG: UDP-N-acetylmuramoyl-L-alanyl-D-glutamate--2,6-diaminopimelate ligase [Paludibacteraceae bacterium]|jgi:UDP-N-acetylmuramoyl-L-alanyl-D-glutamate--2,6-diaminopimelate ligase|nr:UDP-N-acetylmuramoyl-L-alanyl-D-glutamate--2,6-diaminopimelate ligase [Paludibacteraceae bacterium]